jgi:crotonobetainyl-CoA:carnitine CoA-transferase CaiB-like acyl-CoA transferase
MFGPIETRDGYIMLAVASERTFADLARAARREDWLSDIRFAVYAERRRNWHLLVGELEQWSRRLTTVECQVAFDGCGVPCSPYRTVEEAMADPQLEHRRAFGEVRDVAGVFRVLNPPFRFSAAPAGVQPYAAALGEHGAEVLGEAGYTDREIDELRTSGALG